MSTETEQLIDFLLERVAEHEAVIDRAAEAMTAAGLDPARARAQCQAMRAIVTVCSAPGTPMHCRVILSLISLPYTGHPGYHPGWDQVNLAAHQLLDEPPGVAKGAPQDSGSQRRSRRR